MRIRRTTLATPASSPKMMRKALYELGADEVFFDLEDAVPPDGKEAARGNIVEVLRAGRPVGKTVSIRINAISTDWWFDDLREVIGGVGGSIDCVILPKVEGPEDIKVVEKVLRRLEEKHGIGRRIGIEALIETAPGLTYCEEIARSSSRLECLIWGPGDYAADAGIESLTIGDQPAGYPGHIWHYAMFRVNNAAKASGIQAIDGPYAAIDDIAGLERSAKIARQLGFDGKWVVHPSQIEPCNATFTPRADEVERAKMIVGEYERARREGRGVLSIRGEMIDAATYRMASRVLEVARRLGVYHPTESNSAE